MTRKVPPTQLGTPGDSYDKQYMLTLTRSLSAWMAAVQAVGDGVFASLRIINPYGNGSGLSVGQVWMDVNGFLRVVRDGDVFAAPQAISIRIGNVGVQ